MRRKSDTTGPADAGQLLPYYRKEKNPPGTRNPSVWDSEEQEPKTRLTKPRDENARQVAARIVSAAYPSSPVRRRGPATVWDDHEYLRRAPSGLNVGVEEDEDDIVEETWPTRKRGDGDRIQHE